MSDLNNLIAIRSNYIQLLATESAAQITNGPKPSYSLDGESYSWNEYRQQLQAMIEKYNILIQYASGPFQIVSQRRA